MSKEIDSEQRLTSLQKELSDVTSRLHSVTRECEELRRTVAQRDASGKKDRDLAKTLQDAEEARRKEAEKINRDMDRLESELESVQNGQLL